MGEEDTATFPGDTRSFASADQAHVPVAGCFTVLVKRKTDWARSACTGLVLGLQQTSLKYS